MFKALSLFGAVAVLAAASPPSPPPVEGKDARRTLHLAAPADLPAAAREVLHQRMAQHADQLEWLLSAALVLNYDLAEKTATNIADDPKLAPPRASELDTLNASLPKDFFPLQARLAKRARAVAAAARAHDDRKLGRALGALTETCVACHSVYLYGKGAAGPAEESDGP